MNIKEFTGTAIAMYMNKGGKVHPVVTLDIFKKFRPFTITRADRANRCCREFTITYIKN